MKHLLRLALPIVLAAIALGVPAWAAFAPIRTDAREQVYEIPKGTWARRQAGEKFDLIPDTIHLTVGVRDVLVMRNRDDVPHLFGPVLIMPGQSFQLPFRKPASYLFSCPLHTSGQLTIVVDPEPEPGWRRLLWRTTAIVRSASL
jgi:hypothetical protein